MFSVRYTFAAMAAAENARVLSIGAQPGITVQALADSILADLGRIGRGRTKDDFELRLEVHGRRLNPAFRNDAIVIVPANTTVLVRRVPRDHGTLPVLTVNFTQPQQRAIRK